MSFTSVESAIHRLRQGQMIILMDDEHRENEGDLVVAGEWVTPEAINFMAQYGRGLICLPMTAEDFERLGIPMMVSHNRCRHQTAFGVSIGAAQGISTGTSAADRAHTVRVAVSAASTEKDIVMPGHVFPLRGCPGGVLERPGHTEASIELMRLAGLHPAAVICEVMNTDGSMARQSDLLLFSQQHHLPILTVQDLITDRLQAEHHLDSTSPTPTPASATSSSFSSFSASSFSTSQWGKFRIHGFCHAAGQREHLALLHDPIDPSEPVLVRIHSECVTGDVFASVRCDCGSQLTEALRQMTEQGGILLYLRQEGRGIGLVSKLEAYALQDHYGLDTVEANHQLGFAADERDYAVAAQMLNALGIRQVRLLTNNPQKLSGLQQGGVEVVERVPLETVPTADNFHYLKTKRDKLDHWLNLEESPA